MQKMNLTFKLFTLMIAIVSLGSVSVFAETKAEDQPAAESTEAKKDESSDWLKNMEKLSTEATEKQKEIQEKQKEETTEKK